MSYAKIPNLYRSQEVLLFKEVFCLEKIHGSSSHISFHHSGVTAIQNGVSETTIYDTLTFFSGGESYERFVQIFNQEFLREKFKEIGQYDITVFGEVYGGKCQGMSATYGKELKFVAFDVKIGDYWLEVPKAEELVKSLGLEFVDYVKIPTTLEAIDAERDKDSTQAVRNGCGVGKIREGVVLRPLIEVTKNNGERICAKHKRDEFRETKSPRTITDPSQLKLIEDTEKAADEFVTPRRLEHILQKIPNHSIEAMSTIIKNMVEDIKIEGAGEVTMDKTLEKLIGKKTAIMYKNLLTKSLHGN